MYQDSANGQASMPDVVRMVTEKLFTDVMHAEEDEASTAGALAETLARIFKAARS